MNLRVLGALLNTNMKTPQSLAEIPETSDFTWDVIDYSRPRDFADDDTPWIRIHGLILRRQLIFQIIRNKPVTARSRNPRVIAVAVIVDANTRALYPFLSSLPSQPPASLQAFLLALFRSVLSIWFRCSPREEERRDRAFCGLHPTPPWIMQARCNWSPNRNGLLFTFLRS